MLQLDILSGKQAGTRIVARHFPFSVGRSPSDHLRLEDAGVWDGHVAIALVPENKAFVAQANADAALIINGERLQQVTLKNGDLLELGAAKVRIGLTPPKQKSLIFREAATWIGLGLLCAAQIAVIYWLSR
ncbi:MAG: FHA domain-containing protein [Limisphaerales bacterium]